MDVDILIDDVLAALGLLLQFMPPGSPATLGMSLVYEGLVTERSVATHIAPENLRASLAKHLGQTIADELTAKFGPSA